MLGWPLSRSVRRLSALVPGVLLTSILATSVSSANPLPEAWLHIHVHQGSELIASCEEVQQYTEESGQLTFDVYLWPWAAFWEWPEIGLDFINLTATFPPEWTVISAEPATGAVGTISPSGAGEYLVNLTWPPCPTQTDDLQLFWVARFVMDVTSEGYFGAHSVEWDLCYPEPYPFTYADVVEAQAAAGWGHCEQPCGGYGYVVEMDPDPVELEAFEGEMVTAEIQLYLGWLEVEPGFLIHESTAPHVTVEELFLHPWDVRLLVIANALGLDPGYHQSWVRTTIPDQDCRNQAEVLLHVLPVTPTEKVSWGMLKGLYRE